MVKEAQRHRLASHHKVPQKYGGGRGGGWEGGGEEMTTQWQTQQPLDICHIFKNIWFRLPLSSLLCSFLFVAGKTDGPGICFTLQYLRKGFNSFSLTALYHVFTPHSDGVKWKMSIYTACSYLTISETPPSLPPSCGVFVSRLNPLLSGLLHTLRI